MRSAKDARSTVAIAMAVLGFSVFSGIARAGHDHCHALIGSVPGSDLGPSCHFEAHEGGAMHASTGGGGVTMFVEAIDRPTWQWFTASIQFSDGTERHISGRPDVFTLDPLLRSGRLEASFDVDGSTYELIVELDGQEAIQHQYAPNGVGARLFRIAGGRGTLARDSQEIFEDPEAGGQLARFVSGRFGVGIGGCVGPFCRY